jgi:hypothetical protein
MKGERRISIGIWPKFLGEKKKLFNNNKWLIFKAKIRAFSNLVISMPIH